MVKCCFLYYYYAILSLTLRHFHIKNLSIFDCLVLVLIQIRAYFYKTLYSSSCYLLKDFIIPSRRRQVIGNKFD